MTEHYIIFNEKVTKGIFTRMGKDPNMVVFTSGDKKYLIDMKLLKELRE